MAKKVERVRNALNVRAHDPEYIRVWTDEMQGYGSFDVVKKDEFWLFHTISRSLGIFRVLQVHRCDGSSPCNCPLRTPPNMEVLEEDL